MDQKSVGQVYGGAWVTFLVPEGNFTHFHLICSECMVNKFLWLGDCCFTYIFWGNGVNCYPFIMFLRAFWTLVWTNMSLNDFRVVWDISWFPKVILLTFIYNGLVPQWTNFFDLVIPFYLDYCFTKFYFYLFIMFLRPFRTLVWTKLVLEWFLSIFC